MIKACQQHGEDAGKENAVEGAGAADRRNRRTEAEHLVEVGQVGADQRAQAAAYVGERRRKLARQQQRDDSRRHTGKNTGTAMPIPGTG